MGSRSICWSSAGARLLGVEAKSGATIALESFSPLESVARIVPELKENFVVHGGQESWTARGAKAVSYRNLDEVAWV